MPAVRRGRSIVAQVKIGKPEEGQMMRYRVALAVCGVLLAGVGVAAAQPVVPDVGGLWIMTTTITDGNFVDQARIGQGTNLYCAQSEEAMMCESQDGKILLTGGLDGGGVQLKGNWGTEAIHMTLYGGLVNSTLMQGHFEAQIAVGLGAYQASGEWKAIKVRN
jgi:hypothetical protein